MVNQRPIQFTVITKNGDTITFHALFDKGVITGYGYTHPALPHQTRSCKFNWIDTESGSRHKLTFNEQGQATFAGSLKCPQCEQWHVVITDGVAI